VTALVVQCNLPYIAVSKHEVSPEVLGLIPADFARNSRIVPLDRIGNILSIVMMNPMDESKRQEVELITGCRIATFISTRSEIDAAIKRFYGEEK
jgi:type IV pilus assembly protein PilB